MRRNETGLKIYFSIVAILLGLLLGYLRFGFLDSVSESASFTKGELSRAKRRLNLILGAYFLVCGGLLGFYYYLKDKKEEFELGKFRPLLILIFGIFILLAAVVIIVPLYSYPNLL